MNNPKLYVCTSYLDEVYDVNIYRERMEKIVAFILNLKKAIPFDVIAFRGSSGAAYAFPISMTTGIPLFHVRKEEDNHSGSLVEGVFGFRKYIIVDDFIDDGNTVLKIIDAIRCNSNTRSAKCVAIVLCAGDWERVENKSVPPKLTRRGMKSVNCSSRDGIVRTKRKKILIPILGIKDKIPEAVKKPRKRAK